MAINNNVTSGFINGPGPNGEIIGGFDSAGIKIVKPLTFLGGTVLSFNSTLGIGPLEESSLSLEIINDCKVESTIGEPLGDYFLGPGNIGSPVFFDLGAATANEPNRGAYEIRRDTQIAQSGIASDFKFGGILQSYTANQSSNGLTFSARVVDPRSLLGGVNIIVGNTLTGPIKHRNYYNVYAYYEANVLKPELRTPQPSGGFLIAGSPGEDGPVPISSGEIDQEENPGVDCSLFGSSHSNEQGMLYFKIKQALQNMNLMVFSPNYGERHVPELLGRDLTAAILNGGTKHQNNVFKVDISELPDPPDAPLYYRIPGPNITLLDFISQVCEATGYIFHVELIEAPNPNSLHTIKVRVANVRNIVNQDFKSEIISYNGKATDLSYGKELSTENTRTLMLGEQKHQMYETANVIPWFGEDKEGNTITPILPSGSGELASCGWHIEIYLDDLNSKLRCPLYDYATAEEPARDQEVVGRKVKVTEYHLRLAASSMEVWKKFVFNPFNTEDFATIIRRNFPDLTTEHLNGIYKNFLETSETVAKNRAARAVNNSGSGSDSNSGPTNTGTGTPPQVVDEAGGKSMADQLNNWNSNMMIAMEQKRNESIQQVYDFISGLARTYYGKQYLAIMSKDLCVTDPQYVDLKYINPAGIEITSTQTIFNDPCATGEGNVTIINNKVWAPKNYTHVPTNDGAWIEKCGSVLGLGATDKDEHIYLDFFRTEDGRVKPMARFDSKVLTTLRRTEGLIEEGLEIDPVTGEPNVGSIINGLFESGSYRSGIEESDLNILFASGICGDLETREWSDDSYVKLTGSGICAPPISGTEPATAIDLPATVWTSCSVGDKFYFGSGCIEYTERVKYVIGPNPEADPCCGKWQNDVSAADCYNSGSPLPTGEDCFEYGWKEVTKQACNIIQIPITFDNPCFTRYCDDATQMEATAMEIEALMSGVYGQLANDNSSGSDSGSEQNEIVEPFSYDPYSGELILKGGVLIPTTPRFCYRPNPTGISIIASALDFQQQANSRITPTAFIPTAIAIPVRSNLETYGPWKSRNFETSSGGVEVIQDTEFCPWTFDSTAAMDAFAQEFINDRAFNKSEIDTGSVTIPKFPDKPLGFIANGPNLTNINVSMGSNGVTTTYTYRTYTPKFGGLKALEKRALKDNLNLVQQVRRLAREKQRKIDTINRKTSGGGMNQIQPEQNPPLQQQGTLHRILVGESYPFGIICAPTGTDPDAPLVDGWEIIGTGDRTVVGTETLQKSIMELRYDYRKKAFMSWDGLISPVGNTRPDGADHHLPIYAHYPDVDIESSGQAKSIYNSPNPPVRISGENEDESIYNLKINRDFLDPLSNPFASGEHHHFGKGAGHNIDIVGRGSGAPDSGIIMNFYGQEKWDERYSDEYRFLGLRGPLVLHQWGYDTQGKPIPNAIDDEALIRESGIFRTTRESGNAEEYPYISGSGLSDYFMRDWLQKPSSWPVAPVDLRFDRKRGVWVSPPDYKMVVVEAEELVEAYSSGEGFLVNQKDDKKYNGEIYDKEGNLIVADDSSKKAKITIEDRIGRTFNPGEKSYAYFDSFTSTYLLMGGGSSIRIGKFCNQWPSLSNVKDPKNAVKEVVLYEPVPCSGEPCPWNLQPQMTMISGVQLPVTVQAMNLFSNVGAHEYQTKWCAIVQNGNSYYLLAAEC